MMPVSLEEEIPKKNINHFYEKPVNMIPFWGWAAYRARSCILTSRVSKWVKFQGESYFLPL